LHTSARKFNDSAESGNGIRVKLISDDGFRLFLMLQKAILQQLYSIGYDFLKLSG